MKVLVFSGLLSSLLLAGCGGMTVVQRNQTGLAVAAGLASVTPNADIQQTYYLGSFDPLSQLPPAIYRIRVRGQSSILNATRFASGWAPAEVVDSLTGAISTDMKTGTVSTQRGADTSQLPEQDRKLVLFGPEGFRTAPRGHRLVVVMGASPEAVEQAFSSALGTVARVRFSPSATSVERDLFARLNELAAERDQFKTLLNDR